MAGRDMTQADDMMMRELRRQTRLLAERKASRAAVFWLAFVAGGLVMLGVPWPPALLGGLLASLLAYFGKLSRAMNR